jgi:rRNA-processing protein FCF1
MIKVDASRKGSVDDKIISCARGRNDVFVATMDYALRKRLMMENLKCITLSNDKVVLC